MRARQFNRPIGPGYCHFQIAYQQEFFNQLTSEEVRTTLRARPCRALLVQAIGERNEALDRRVYALASLHARPVPLGGTLARRANRVVVFDKLLRE